jgi:hypothetical protein
MAKKSSGKPKGEKPKAGMSPTDHRKMAEQHHAKARLHSAQADLMDAKNPPKSKKGTYPGVY